MHLQRQVIWSIYIDIDIENGPPCHIFAWGQITIRHIFNHVDRCTFFRSVMIRHPLSDMSIIQWLVAKPVPDYMQCDGGVSRFYGVSVWKLNTHALPAAWLLVCLPQAGRRRKKKENVFGCHVRDTTHHTLSQKFHAAGSELCLWASGICVEFAQWWKYYSISLMRKMTCTCLLCLHV